MSRTKHELKTAILDDGTHAVLRADPAKPRYIEVIATFYQAENAKDYVRRHSAPAEHHHEEKRPGVKPAVKRRRKLAAAAKSRPATKTGRKTPSAVKPKAAAVVKTKRRAAVQPKSTSVPKSRSTATGVSDRQLAVLKALRSLKDKKNRVEAPVAKIAKASSVPLGSVHSILVSLEKKHMIRTERRGSAKASAIYKVLQTSPKSAGSLNGGHRKPPHAQAAR
jgi:hypothetical protein